jgi:transcriptional regulator with XRE-family HTH domain
MTEELKKQIASRLRLARENAGLSQGQVAKKMNLHRPTVSEIEAGRRRVSAEELARFAEL